MSDTSPRSNSGRNHPPPASVLFLDKQPGVSSFAALGTVKRAAGTRKVGHTGTLDPFATGLLIALIGQATRTARYFNGLGKRYRATVTFGTQTDTDDATGTVISEAPLPPASELDRALDAFRGTIEQVPPAYSAIHVDGRRAHEIARSGNQPDIPTRTVTVSELNVESVRTNEEGSLERADVLLECSAGTYVRSIARDLGVAMGSRAHVETLRRTAIGPFSIERAVAHDAISLPDDLHDLAEVLGALPDLTIVEIAALDAERVAHGKQLHLDRAGMPREGRVVLTCNGVARAVGVLEGGRFSYEMVVARPLASGGDGASE